MEEKGQGCVVVKTVKRVRQKTQDEQTIGKDELEDESGKDCRQTVGVPAELRWTGNSAR